MARRVSDSSPAVQQQMFTPAVTGLEVQEYIAVEIENVNALLSRLNELREQLSTLHPGQVFHVEHTKPVTFHSGISLIIKY